VANQIIGLSRARIIVEGHTDDVGDEGYNQALSLARANAVKNYLIRIIPNQENYSWLTKGAGSSQPIASNTTPEGRQQNRRVDLIIAP
jgi:outer membrane protein OmpA-like peptidoglycan-associated protein